MISSNLILVVSNEQEKPEPKEPEVHRYVQREGRTAWSREWYDPFVSELRVGDVFQFKKTGYYWKLKGAPLLQEGVWLIPCEMIEDIGEVLC